MENNYPTKEQLINFDAKVKQLLHEGEYFKGYTIEGDDLCISSETHCSGCGTDTFDDNYSLDDILHLSIEELNQQTRDKWYNIKRQHEENQKKVKELEEKSRYENAKKVIQEFEKKIK